MVLGPTRATSSGAVKQTCLVQLTFVILIDSFYHIGAHHRDGLSAVNYYGTIYAFGGQGRYTSSAECSYYASYHWEDCKQKMTAPRFGHRSVVDADTIIHFGGNYAGSEL